MVRMLLFVRITNPATFSGHGVRIVQFDIPNEALGAGEWVHTRVLTTGWVFRTDALRFRYSPTPRTKEEYLLPHRRQDCVFE